MSIDVFDLLPVATRLVRSRTKDIPMPRAERGQFVEEEALSLAYVLAEVADNRIDELHDGIARGVTA